jgi:16S rRNA processing protein RimM
MGPRSTSRSISDGLVVGVIKTPHGVRGEVTIDPRSDVPDRFRVGATLDCDGLGPLTIRSIRGTARVPIVGFEGYASRPEAEPLRGRFLRVGLDEARRATKGRYLWADLVGLRAEAPDGEPIGSISDIIRAGETDVFVVRRAQGGELLVPAIASVVREVDLAGGRVVIAPQEEL